MVKALLSRALKTPSQIQHTTVAEWTMGGYDIATALLYQLVSPLLLIFGTVGNVLTIVVLSKRRLSMTSTEIFLISLAVADLLVLNTGLLRFWIKYTFNTDVRHVSEGLCCFQRFSIFFTTQFSSWMLVCVTLERLVGTWIPHRRVTMCNKKIAIEIVGAIGVVLACLNSHYLFGFGNKHITNGNVTEVIKCVPISKKYEMFIYHEWTIIDMCIFYLIPMVVLVVGNTAIVYKFIKSRKKLRQSVAPFAPRVNNMIQQRSAQAHKTSSLTMTLVIISSVYVVCVAPIVIYPIGEPYWSRGASETRQAMLTLVETIAVLVMYVNHSINFVLYFLSGTKFRQDVKKLLCSRCGGGDNDPTGPTSGL